MKKHIDNGDFYANLDDCGIRSTGRICTNLAPEFDMQGYKVKIAYGREDT